MKRISYWILSTLSAVVLLVGFDASQRGGVPTATSETPYTSTVPTTPSATPGAEPSTSATPSGAGKTPKKKATTSTSATVTGSVAQTQWGPVQVQLVVASGSITTVRVLQYPNGNGRDAEINSYALPILIRETQEKQSASIDMVSGATVTSTGYLQSLQSAIDQAGL